MVEPRLDVFAPDDFWWQFLGFYRDPGAVYASVPLVYGSREYAQGGVFVLKRPLEDPLYMAAKAVQPVAPHYRPVPHPPTGLYFIDSISRDAYARRYATRDTSGLVFWEPKRPREKKSAAGAARKRPGPPPAGWKSWTREETLAKFVEATAQLFAAPRSPRARRARLPWEHLCRFMNDPRMGRNKIAEIARYHGITKEEIVANLHR